MYCIILRVVNSSSPIHSRWSISILFSNNLCIRRNKKTESKSHYLIGMCFVRTESLAYFVFSIHDRFHNWIGRRKFTWGWYRRSHDSRSTCRPPPADHCRSGSPVDMQEAKRKGTEDRTLGCINKTEKQNSTS